MGPKRLKYNAFFWHFDADSGENGTNALSVRGVLLMIGAAGSKTIFRVASIKMAEEAICESKVSALSKGGKCR